MCIYICIIINLFMFHNNLFDNHVSKINKINILLGFDILSITKKNILQTSSYNQK